MTSRGRFATGAANRLASSASRLAVFLPCSKQETNRSANALRFSDILTKSLLREPRSVEHSRILEDKP
jgi:hypothetical protein